MDTTALKSFAPKARTTLIADVEARVGAVLAPTSTERVESPTAVARLERAVVDAGGGAVGRAAVAERVAYTWFNRIVALRFMDAKGYTGVGVVSPPAGQTAGQPEILSRARAGAIDADVASPATAAKVAALLDGTRRSNDPQGEAYAALLEAYCRKWADTMKDIFGTGGDETELLIPAGLLADTSVRAQAVDVLTPVVCEDVEVIGWLYQFYISERKNEVFAGFKKNKKAGPAEIPAATQLFTPDWIVRYLVENSLGRLWMLNYPQSVLRAQMDYYVDPVDEVTDFLKISSPEEIKVVDPACGSGHMLTYAFDLLYEIYEEEGYAPSEIPSLILAHNLYGIEIDPRAEALASFALTMKARSKDRRFFTRGTKPNVRVLTPIRFTPDELDLLRPPTLGGAKGSRGSETLDLFDPPRQEIDSFWNQFEYADTFGSLIQPDASLIEPLRHHVEALDDNTLGAAELREAAGWVLDQADYLTRRYHVAVANPPYMGSNSMGDNLVGFAKSSYPITRSDLYTMFMERATVLCDEGGMWGVITPHGWMFQSSFSAWRRWFLSNNTVANLVHFGRGVFGSDWASAAFVAQRAVPAKHVSAVYRKLYERALEVRPSEFLEKLFLSSEYQSYVVEQASFLGIDGSPFAYWLLPEELAIYRDHPQLSTMGTTRQGLATGDNNRFLRFWWEVSGSRVNRNARDGVEAAASCSKWFPLQKGGTPRRWAGNDEYLVDWSDDGNAIKTFGAEFGGRPKSRAQNTTFYFREGATWSSLGGEFAMRFAPSGYVFETKGSMFFPERVDDIRWLLGYLNTPIARALIDSISPTLDYHEGPVGRIPVIRPTNPGLVTEGVDRALEYATTLWSRLEVSPSFSGSHLGRNGAPNRIQDAFEADIKERVALEESILEIERVVEDHFRTSGAIGTDAFRLKEQRPTGLLDDRLGDPSGSPRLLAEDLVSFAIGCVFGRYSLDVSGLVLADQGSTLMQYQAKLAEAGVAVGQFQPDEDGVLPIVDGEWFADDIVTRFREFLRVAFGEDHLADNVRFVEESLGVKTLREYFITKTGKSKFYDDHVRRYKKRPIYWMFSSPRGSFNALVYLHRYTPSTAGTVLNEYLREYEAKLASAIAHEERVAASSSSPRDAARAAKEAERLRKVVTELDAYEHDVLYPLAARQIALDLDDGVKGNYPKLGAALRKIVGLEASDG